jgi:hypothetical protein
VGTYHRLFIENIGADRIPVQQRMTVRSADLTKDFRIAALTLAKTNLIVGLAYAQHNTYHILHQPSVIQ